MGEWWLRWFPAQDLAPATLETYAQQYRRHVHPYFGERALAEIRGLDLAGFARSLRAQGLAPSTVTVVLSVIRDLLVDAAAEGLIPVAPGVRLRLRRNGAGAPVRPGFAVGAEEVLAVCARLQRPDALMAMIAFFTGMRRSARYTRTCTRAASSGRQRAATGARSICPRSWWACSPSTARPSVGLIYCSIRHSDFLRRWRPACDGAAQRLARDGRVLAAAIAPRCPGLRFHDLRHSHKTLLTELGVPEVLQDERLGHHPPGMRTAYAHATAAMRTAMLEGLERTWQHTTAQLPIRPQPDP